MSVRSMGRLVLCIGLLMSACATDDGLWLDEGDARLPSFIERRLGVTIRPGPTGFDGSSVLNLNCSPASCSPQSFDLAVYRACVHSTGLNRTIGLCGTGISTAEDSSARRTSFSRSSSIRARVR